MVIVLLGMAHMSPNQNLSRRDFLKLTLLSLTATFLAACGRARGIPVTPSPTHKPTSNIVSGIL